MLQENKADNEAGLCASRNTGSLLKYYRTFATTQIPTSIHLKNEFATDPLSQANICSNFFASIFLESSDFTPTSNLSVPPNLEEFDRSINRIECIAEGLDLTKNVFKNGAKISSKSLSQIIYKTKPTFLKRINSISNFQKRLQI